MASQWSMGDGPLWMMQRCLSHNCMEQWVPRTENQPKGLLFPSLNATLEEAASNTAHVGIRQKHLNTKCKNQYSLSITVIIPRLFLILNHGSSRPAGPRNGQTPVIQVSNIHPFHPTHFFCPSPSGPEGFRSLACACCSC